MRHLWVLRVRWGCLVLLIGVLRLCLGMRTDKAPAAQGLPPGLQRLLEAERMGPEEAVKVRTALRVNYRMADISLAIREHVDFLLTPALLVQEAVSDGVILTYPEE